MKKIGKSRIEPLAVKSLYDKRHKKRVLTGFSSWIPVILYLGINLAHE
jgi:hypothetical protein